MNHEHKGKILVLYDEPAVLKSLARILTEEGYQVKTSSTAAGALALFQEGGFEVLIADWKLPDLDGLQVMEDLKKKDPDLSMIMMTGHPDVDTAVKAMKLGVVDYVRKPFEPDRMVSLLNGVMAERKTRSLKQEQAAAFETIKREISATVKLKEILDLIVSGVVRIMRVKGSSLSLLDKNREELRIVSSFGLSPAYCEKGPLDSTKSIGEMVLKGDQVLIRNAQKDPRIQYPEEARREGIVSILSLPLRIKSRVLGALRIYTAEPREFAGEEMDWLYRFADEGALAISRARSFEDVQDQYEALRQDLFEIFPDGWA